MLFTHAIVVGRRDVEDVERSQTGPRRRQFHALERVLSDRDADLVVRHSFATHHPNRSSDVVTSCLEPRVSDEREGEEILKSGLLLLDGVTNVIQQPREDVIEDGSPGVGRVVLVAKPEEDVEASGAVDREGMNDRGELDEG